jgi:hypothetical protein
VEERVSYQTSNDTLLHPEVNRATIEPGQAPGAPFDPAYLERILVPLLNWARQAQGKKPVILPKG